MRALHRLTAALVVPVLFAGCASTKLTGVYVAPEKPLPAVKKVLVIAVSSKLAYRQTVEYEFVEGFKNYGVEAVASIDIMSPEQELKKEEVEAAIEGRSIDSVIVTRLMGIDTEVRQAPSSAVVASSGYGGYYGYYHSAYVVAYVPGALETYDNILLETKLYNIDREDVIWSAQSKTFDPASVEQLSTALTNAVLWRMAKDGVLER
jgi:hypothetical protein